jgi:hypothetical protein
MAELRIYRAPNGACFQYPEGEQPKGYELVKPAPKKRTARNKAVKPADK